MRVGRQPVPSLILALIVGLLATTVASAATPRVSLMTVEANVMCVSCHEPLELAQSPQATAEKQYVKGLVGQGLTLRQIEKRLVAQYGVAVLGKPPAQGFNLTVYILPPVLLLLGLGGLLFALPRWRARSGQNAAEPGEQAPPVSAADAERLDQDLARFI